ncbi:PREDICTED: F-box protein At1g53790-like, partial [Camelina sativa]|uniref:F-box protein At1g53790-like n=1 Tax=Camelina sativa TaxID=90675 RepID=A0ABM1R6G3_CAMSA
WEIEDEKHPRTLLKTCFDVVVGDKVSSRDLEQGKPPVGCSREIPMDLLMDILSRVPAKSIARFRCISKLLQSFLCSPYFADLFLTKTLSVSPLLLFTVQNNGKLFFFSSPLPQNLDENNTSLVPTRYQVQRKNSPADFSFEMASPLCGFICHRDKGSVDTLVVCNPVTGQSVTLPKVELKSVVHTRTRPYLGYDSIHEQLKVLFIKSGYIPNTCDEHQVLTLDSGKHLWRKVQCEPHYPISNGICVDGILYYTAIFYMPIRVFMVACFDVVCEKFSFINIDESMPMTSSCTLINYKGKLGTLQFRFVSQSHLELWVLEDAEKYIWTEYSYTLPLLWNDNFKRIELVIVGMTSGGEVVLSPCYCPVDAFYIYYFNLESEGLTSVPIQQSLAMFKGKRLYTSLDYAENLKLI